eukprot:1190915-Prymnesium_polylepis.1
MPSTSPSPPPSLDGSKDAACGAPASSAKRARRCWYASAASRPDHSAWVSEHGTSASRWAHIAGRT